MNFTLSQKLNFIFIPLCCVLLYLGTRKKPNPPPPAVEQNQGVAVSCVEVETTKPDGTKTREIKFSAVANQAQKITPTISAPISYRATFIPNYNFESMRINYAMLLEKRIAGECYAGIYANVDGEYKIQNAGGSLSCGF